MGPRVGFGQTPTATQSLTSFVGTVSALIITSLCSVKNSGLIFYYVEAILVLICIYQINRNMGLMLLLEILYF
jgi:hypothetical protein